MADSVRRGTTLRESERIRTGADAGKDCGRPAASTCCGGVTSFSTSGKAILLVAFIATPETPRHISANVPQENQPAWPKIPKEKEWSDKMPLEGVRRQPVENVRSVLSSTR